LRKIIKNRGHFPNDAAATKLLWLAIMTIEDKRARQRAKEAGTGRLSQAFPSCHVWVYTSNGVTTSDRLGRGPWQEGR
ncbi:MAG: hypothetical protein M0Z87_11890, partial [Actinomycetota bacterium]|nr:hypothetical protein [Actinomycetota bacterium]